MAVAAAGALIAGAAMVGAGTAAAIRANRINAKPRGVAYGGSPEALDAYRDQYASGIGYGGMLRDAGIQDMSNVGTQAAGTAQYGQGLIAGALDRSRANTGYGAMQAIQQTGSVANNAADVGGRIALDQAMSRNTALAQTGGALGMRSAMAANADASAQIAQQNAAIRAQNAVAQQQAIAQQFNTNDAINQSWRGLDLQEAGLGAGLPPDRRGGPRD
jgi:hypothetical protein